MKEITIKVTKRRARAMNHALSEYIGGAKRTLNRMENKPLEFAIFGSTLDETIQDQKLYIKDLQKLSASINRQCKKHYPYKN